MATELEKTKNAYSHFTLEQWKLMARSVMKDTALSDSQRHNILMLFPSAALASLS